MIVAAIIVGIAAVAVFVYAAGQVSAAECCACPHECGEHAAEYPEP